MINIKLWKFDAGHYVCLYFCHISLLSSWQVNPCRGFCTNHASVQWSRTFEPNPLLLQWPRCGHPPTSKNLKFPARAGAKSKPEALINAKSTLCGAWKQYLPKPSSSPQPAWLSMVRVRANVRRARESQEIQFPEASGHASLQQWPSQYNWDYAEARICIWHVSSGFSPTFLICASKRGA